MPRLAIDISNYAGLLKPETVECWKQTGVQMVIVRLSTEDARKIAIAKQQLQICLEGGLDVGGYVWLYFDGQYSGTVQVENALVHYGDYPLKVWALDVEDKSILTIGQSVKVIWEAVQISREFAKPVYIYTSPEAWQRLAGNTNEFGDVPLWTVLWSGKPAEFQSYGGWQSWQAMQIQGDTEMCGVGCDINIWRV